MLELPFFAAIRSPVQWVFDRHGRRRRSGVGGNGQYLAVSLSAADAELSMTGDELRGRFLPALADLLPAAREANVEAFFVTREHAATFLRTHCRGARAAARTAHRRSLGLVLAGTWTDTGWPATMEGAVRAAATRPHGRR